ncbi:MAG: guanylate kinase [Bacteroidales bacterium]|nr:guanylate kinase [Bacteroidales bacterium]
MSQRGKLIIFSAPSGSGKSTLINYLMQQGLPLSFSVSATSRAPRGEEQHGKEYYFLSVEEFRTRIKQGDFLEYEEVYPGKFYGTLKSEVERLRDAGRHVIFDVDVVGGVNIKRFYADDALSIFIQPPSVEVLHQRLVGRGTDAPDVIATRIAKAEQELTYAAQFDCVVVNDVLQEAQREVLELVSRFIGR